MSVSRSQEEFEAYLDSGEIEWRNGEPGQEWFGVWNPFDTEWLAWQAARRKPDDLLQKCLDWLEDQNDLWFPSDEIRSYLADTSTGEVVRDAPSE